MACVRTTLMYDIKDNHYLCCNRSLVFYILFNIFASEMSCLNVICELQFVNCSMPSEHGNKDMWLIMDISFI
jgi:hypothetical protein